MYFNYLFNNKYYKMGVAPGQILESNNLIPGKGYLFYGRPPVIHTGWWYGLGNQKYQIRFLWRLTKCISSYSQCD